MRPCLPFEKESTRLGVPWLSDQSPPAGAARLLVPFDKARQGRYLLVLVLQIPRGLRDIALGCRQLGVAQEAFQRDRIYPVLERATGEGMPQGVGVEFDDAELLGHLVVHRPDRG